MKNTIEKLVKFASQKPGLTFADYGEISSYRREMREITGDLHDFREFLNLAFIRLDSDFDRKLTEYLQKSGDRLTLNEAGELRYITGQYFPTEYRPACNRVLKSLIWDSLRETKDSDGNYIYNDGDSIRAYFKKNLSRKCFRNYFR